MLKYVLIVYLGIGIYLLFINPFKGFIISGYKSLIKPYIKSNSYKRKMTGYFGAFPVFLVIILLMVLYPIVFLIRRIKGVKSFNDQSKYY